VHATVIAKWRNGLWRGVLLFGASGAGKSDLALRALQAGWRLVADDYALAWRSGGSLWARAPETIVDRIEARGLGVVPEPTLGLAQAVLAVKCEPGPSVCPSPRWCMSTRWPSPACGCNPLKPRPWPSSTARFRRGPLEPRPDHPIKPVRAGSKSGSRRQGAV
jgi:hypothetical protein